MLRRLGALNHCSSRTDRDKHRPSRCTPNPPPAIKWPKWKRRPASCPKNHSGEMPLPLSPNMPPHVRCKRDLPSHRKAPLSGCGGARSDIFESGELTREATVSKMEIVRAEGEREVAREVKFYNLDAIIAVGYRVNSYQATQFRIWATKTLREFIIKGFVLDDERLKQGKQVFGKDCRRQRVRSRGLSGREDPPSPRIPPSPGFGGTSWRDKSSLTFEIRVRRDYYVDGLGVLRSGLPAVGPPRRTNICSYPS